VAGEIGQALRGSPRHPVVCLRSTVIPGTSENIFIPAVEQYSGKKIGSGFSFVYHPEFLRETSAITDYDAPGRVVFGTLEGDETNVVDQIYSHISAPRFYLNIKEAEFVKYCDNVYHALKITFANEIGSISKKLNIDSHKIMDVFVADEKLNISKLYFKPGFSFGGSCLPKDISAITYLSRKLELRNPLIESLLISNDNKKVEAFQSIYELEPQGVAFLGIAFKKAVGLGGRVR